MMTDETANYRWSVESPGNHAKRAEKTLDAALEATKPPKKWYGGTPPRSDNAFKQYEHQLGKALKGMTNDDVRTLADAASKRAETLDGTGPRGAADRRLMKEIETMAVATQSHRKNRTMTDLDSLTSSRDPAVMRRTVQDMEPDRLRLLNQRANGVGSGPVDAATRRACTTVNNVASSRFGRTCGYSGKGPDRIPSPAQKEELLTTDMTHTYKKSDYLIEATPPEREKMKAALSSRLKTAPENKRLEITRALNDTQEAIDQGPAFRGLRTPFETKTHDRKSEQCVTRGAGRPAGGAMPTRAPARARVEQAAAR